MMWGEERSGDYCREGGESRDDIGRTGQGDSERWGGERDLVIGMCVTC